MIRTLSAGKPYYKMAADLLRCPVCASEIYAGFSRNVIEAHDPKYNRMPTPTVDVEL